MNSLSQENPLQTDQIRVPALSLCDPGWVNDLTSLSLNALFCKMG